METLMSDKKEIVETVYGKYNKYEIMKESGGVFTSPKFYVYKDGKPFKGSFSSLRDAIEVAKNPG
jgi:hypothetical protein